MPRPVPGLGRGGYGCCFGREAYVTPPSETRLCNAPQRSRVPPRWRCHDVLEVPLVDDTEARGGPMCSRRGDALNELQKNGLGHSASRIVRFCVSKICVCVASLCEHGMDIPSRLPGYTSCQVLRSGKLPEDDTNWNLVWVWPAMIVMTQWNCLRSRCSAGFQ
jgi:hypothetical protein